MAVKIEADERSASAAIQKIKKVAKGLEKISGMAVKIGYLGPSDPKDARKEGAMTNLGLAQIHEFGAPSKGIPARPFLFPAYEEKKKAARKELERAVRSEIGGSAGAVESALMSVGLAIQATAKNNIVAQKNFAPLKPATIRARQRKKFAGTKALIHTGQLMNAIQVKVEK